MGADETDQPEHPGEVPVWDSVAIGDAAPAAVYDVTAEKIAEFSRTARYENLVYASQPAAREAGLAGIIAPPAMVLVYAPARLAELLTEPGLDAPEQVPGSLTTVKVVINSQGVMVSPGDVVTSVTSVQDKFQEGEDRFITLRVTGVNQRNEPVADYCWTYRWSEVVPTGTQSH